MKKIEKELIMSEKELTSDRLNANPTVYHLTKLIHLIAISKHYVRTQDITDVYLKLNIKIASNSVKH